MTTTPHPRAKKSLGQNFLQDANIARKIVRLLDLGPDDSVLEIGPGPGALTSIVQGQGAKRLVLVEKDDYWARQRILAGTGRVECEIAGDEEAPDLGPADGLFLSASDFWGEAKERDFAVVMADALTLPWENFSGAWKCIGNLPYNIASPLMWEMFSRMPEIRRAVFMIQKEVGQRIVAAPGTSAYGALSVWLQSFVRAKLEFIVPPQVFHPRPKVDSAVLSFVPLGQDKGDFVSAQLAATLHACFQMRRKQLGTIARSHGAGAAAFEGLGISPELRPEALKVSEFHALSRAGIFGQKD